MKKLLMILGGIFAVIIIVFIIIAIIFIPHALKLDKEATAYIQTNVPIIVADWDAKRLTERASPELTAEIKSKNEADRWFKMFSQLGGLKHLDKPEGRIFSGTFTKQGSYTAGNYTAAADFDKGSASINIQLLRVGDGWKINGFRIYSDVFLPPNSTPENSQPPTTNQ